MAKNEETRQRPLRAHGKENVDGKAAEYGKAQKRHRRARLCLVFLTNTAKQAFA
jgi:hypothetical protein